MSAIGKLKRVMDLFQEGKELVLEEPEGGPAALLWINKPNSFEVDEARRDGIAARALKMQMLRSGEDPEMLAFDAELADMEASEIIDRIVSNFSDEDFVLAMDDVESDPTWSENLDMLRRAQAQLDDAGAAEDDARREEITKVTEDYMRVLRETVEKRQEGRRATYEAKGRDELRDELFEQYLKRIGTEEFMAEKRITEIWFSVRDCLATKRNPDGSWDHGDCNHSIRLLDTRTDVRSLPEELLKAIHSTLEEVEVDARTAGNSDAPVSSSASSEPQSAPEASTPSTPVETPSGVLTT